MKMRKGFQKALSLVMTGLMVLSLITVSGSTERVAAAETEAYDAASQVNFSTALGRAVDFGLTAGKITQNGHMETTIATNLFKNGGANNDVDLAGDSPAHFIIGGLDGDSKVVLGKTYNDGPMIYNVETTPAVAEKDTNGNYKYILPDNNCKADIVVKTETEDAIKGNINRMIEHAKDESDAMLTKTTLNLAEVMDVAHPPHAYIDLTDEKYEGKAVYINANDNDVLLAALQNTGQLHIKKRSSTVIVFNVKGFENTQLNLNKYFVQVLQEDGTLSEEISSGDQTYSGNDSTHNQDIDREIAQKIIWNVPDATNVRIDNTAGTFLVMDPDAFVSVGSSAGWCITPGEISTHGEWHYIYHGRSNDVNADENFNKDMHFAARKAFSEKLTKEGLSEIKTQSAAEGEYTFDFYQTDSDFKTDGKTPLFSNSNDANSKIKFDKLTFNDAGTFYYVIKEQNAGTYSNGVKNSTGEIDIKLVVTKNSDGSMNFDVSSWYYLSKEDKDSNKVYKENTNVKMSDVEFSLGGFYNQVTDEVGTLKITKMVTGDLDSTTKAEKEFKITVTNDSNKYINASGAAVSTDPGLKIKAGETLTISDLPYGKYKIVEDTDDAQVKGYNLDVTGANNETVEIKSISEVEKIITNKYTKITPVSVPIKKLGSDTNNNGLAGAVFSVSKDGVIQPEMGWTSTTDAHTLIFTEEGKYIIHEDQAPNQYAVADDITITVSKVGNSLKAYRNGTLINTTVEITDKKMVPNRIGSITIEKTIKGDVDFSQLVAKGTYFVIKCTNQTGSSTDRKGSYLKMVDGSTVENPGPYNGEKVGEFTTSETEARIPLNSTNFTKSADGKYSLTLSRIIIDTGCTYTYEVTEYNADVNSAVYTWTVSPEGGKNTVNLATDATNKTAAFTNEYTEKKGNLTVTKTVDVTKGSVKLPSSVDSKWFYFTITNEAGKYLDENGELYTEKKILKLRNGETITINKEIPVGKYTVTEIIKDESKGIDSSIQYYSFVEASSTTTKTVEVTETAPVTAELKNVYESQRGNLTITKKVVNAPSTMTNHQYQIGLKDEEGHFMYINPENENSTLTDLEGTRYYPLKNGVTVEYYNLPVGIYTVVEKVDDASIAEYNLTITGDYKADAEGNKLDYGEGHHYVVAGETTNVTVVNTYKDIPTGKIKVTKTLSGAPDNTKEFKFIVTTENGKRAVLDNKGTLGDLSNAKEFTIKSGTPITVSNLPLGKYIVKEVEKSTVIEGYTLNSSSRTSSGVIELKTKDEEVEAQLINTYEAEVEKGSLKITKVKDSESGIIPDTVKFDISVRFDKAGKYKVVQGSTTTTPEFAANTAQTFKLGIGESVTISEIPVGTGYTVTENIPETMTEYADPVISDSGTGSIVKEGSTVTVTNKRNVAAKGSIKLTKTIEGDVNDNDLKNLKFVVEDESDVVWTGTLGDTTKFTKQEGPDSNKYVATISGLDTNKKYTVTESLYDIGGKTVTVTYNVGGGDVTGDSATGITVPANGEKEVSFTDKYESALTGKIELTKTIEGAVNDNDLENLKFIVTDGTKQVWSGKLGDTDKFTKPTGTDNKYVAVISGLDINKEYTVTESLYDIDGKTVTVKYNIGAGDVTGDSATGIKVSANDVTKVSFTDIYTAAETGKIKITKTIKGEITQEDLDKLTFTVKKGTKVIGKYVLGESFSKNEEGNYEKVIEDLTVGEDYSVTESMYTITGKYVEVNYKITADAESEKTGDNDTASGIAVKSGKTTNVDFENNYYEAGSIKLTKTIEGPVTEAEAKGALVFTITRKNDANYSKVVKLSEFTYDSVTKKYTYTLDKLVDDEYYVEETTSDVKDYKTVSVKYSIGENGEVEGKKTTGITVNGDEKQVTFMDKYDSYAGKITITKTIEGPVTEAEAKGALVFTITRKNDANYSKVVKLSEFTYDSVTKKYTYTLDKLVDDEYYVEETTSDVKDYKTVSVKYSIGENGEVEGKKTTGITVNGDEKQVTFMDKYDSYAGKITITKTIEGPVTEAEAKGALVFTITRKNDANYSKVVKLSEFTYDSVTKKYTYTLDKLVDDEYYVEETTYDVPNYETVSVKYSIGETGEVEGKKTAGIAVSGDEKQVTFMDTYDSYAGKITITKTIEGPVTEAEAKGALVFTITRKNDANYSKVVKLSEFTYDSVTKKYTYTLDKLVDDEYYVEETTYDVPNYETVSVKYSIGETGEVEGKKTTGITVSGDEKQISFKDNYNKKEENTSTDKGALVVRKTFAGDSLTDAQKKEITFSVKKKDGTDVAFFTYDKMNAMGDYTVSDLEPGDYTVTETQYDVTGMKVVVTYETTTSGTGAVANVTVTAGSTARANFTNTYTKDEEATTQEPTTQATTEEPTTQATSTEDVTTEDEEDDEEDAKGTLIITIYDEKTGAVVPGAKIKVTSPSGKTKSYTTDKNGQVKISNTDAGTYKVVVTDVPEGYTVTENAEVEVKVKKNKVTKAKVKIDKEGNVSVTTRRTNSSAKTGDSVPVIPIATGLVLAIIGLFILIRRRQNA